jgi:hypothetical protein
MVERRYLPVPVEDAAALVLDWARDPEWRSAVSAMEVQPAGPARAGQRIRETLRFAGLPFVTPTTITAAHPTAACFSGGSGVVAVEGRRSVVPAEDGCTVVLELEVRLTGPLAVLNPLLTPGYRRRFTAEADSLAQATSSTARSAEPTSRV